MLERYSFLPVFLALFVGLLWWQAQVSINDVTHTSTSPAPTSGHFDLTTRRQELIEVLDRIVSYQHYYHSIYGRFTKMMSRIGYIIPESLAEAYDIRITEASKDRLKVTAYSETNGETLDLVSVDQDYQVRSSFSLPLPRLEYLKSHALKHLRLLREAPAGQVIAEQGIYKGYFEYSMRSDSQKGKIGTAWGLISPVEGVLVEVSDLSPLTDSVLSNLEDSSPISTGQNSNQDLFRLEEERVLAQKIFLGEIGRYAKNWGELSKIAHFNFDLLEHLNIEEADPSKSLIREARRSIPSRNISSVVSSKDGLVIESIDLNDVPQ